MFYDIMGEEDETNPLLGESRAEAVSFSPFRGNSNVPTVANNSPYANISSGGIMSNFHTLCLSFGLNHAVVVACLAFSSTLLGNDIGSSSLGIMYVCFAIAAFFFSNVFVLGIGSRESMLLGLTGYTVQASLFFVCLLTITFSSTLTWMIAIPAYTIGGISAGIVWTAQGRIYRLHAKLYSDRTGHNISHVNNQFAAIFTAYFLGFEALLKFMSTVIYFMISRRAEYVIFLTYAVLAWVACILGYRLLDLDEPPSMSFSWSSVGENAALTGKLLYLDVKLMLLVPFQIAYGLTSSMMTFYIIGTVIAGSSSLGASYVGFFAAIVVIAGALVAAPMSRLADRQGKSMVILMGNLFLLSCGLIVFFFPDSTIGTFLFMIPFSIIFGFGRGIWENTNKAVIADFYQNNATNSTAAFAVAAFFNGYASAIGFFCFNFIKRQRMAEIIIFITVVSAICSQLAFIVQISQQKEEYTKAHRFELAKRQLQEHRHKMDQAAHEKYVRETEMSVTL